MSLELVIWILFPMLLGLALVALSTACAWKTGEAVQWLAVPTVTFGVVWSEIVLVGILRGGWPTFWPHIVLGAAGLVVIGQAADVVRRAFRDDPAYRR